MFMKKLIYLICLFVLPFQLFASPYTRWTSVGSTGTYANFFNSADESVIVRHGPFLTLKQEFVGRIQLVYNVTEYTLTSDGTFLEAIFVDGGVNSSVTIELVEVAKSDFFGRTIYKIHSDDYVQDHSIQSAVDGSCWAYSMDFTKYVYYVQVTLEKTESDGNPWIKGLKLFDTLC